MEVAQDTFISSTFWTERIGNVAGLKTLEIMEKERSWESITRVGSSINRRWEKLASKFDLPLEISGLPALTSFKILSTSWQIYKTLMTQEMLGRGFLATNAIYVSTEHTPELIDEYFEHLEPIFSLIAECEAGRPTELLLKGPVSHTGFRRLN
jgi:glutamate-1-semialdehyde 2,1-aminomutase